MPTTERPTTTHRTRAGQITRPAVPGEPMTGPTPFEPTTGVGGASLRVEYVDQDVTLRLTPDPDDVDASARLLCAAVQHVRRRHARRLHTAFDLTGPSSGTLVAALQDRVGIDVGDIVMRRAGSSVMVTADLLPAGGAVPAPHAAPRPRLGGRPRERDARPTTARHHAVSPAHP